MPDPLNAPTLLAFGSPSLDAFQLARRQGLTQAETVDDWLDELAVRIGGEVAEAAFDALRKANSALAFASHAAALAAVTDPEFPADVLTVYFLTGAIVSGVRRQTGGPCLGGGWAPADGFYSPLHFGARGDGVTDDGAAFNAALAAYKTRVEAVVGSSGSLDFDLCGQVYVTTLSLNFTGITSWGWGIKNGTIIGRCTGKPVLDGVGSRGGRYTDLVIYGDRAFPPSVGIQAARASVGGQEGFCDNCLYEHVMTRGFFGIAGAWFYGQETTTYNHCAFWNENPNGAAAFHVGTDAFDYNGVNPMLMQSDYLAPITGETSYINNLYSNCDWRFLPSLGIYNGTALTRGASTVFTLAFPPVNFAVGQTVAFLSEDYQTAAYGVQGVITAISGNNVTVAINSSGWAAYSGQHFSLIRVQVGATVVFGRGRDHNFTSCYIVSYGDYALDVVFGANGIDTMDKINLDFLFEGVGPGYIRFRNDRPGLGLISGAITMYQVRCRDHCIAAPGAQTIVLHDMHVSVPGARHTTPLIFDNPARYEIVGGRIFTYQADRLPRTGWAAFRTMVADKDAKLSRLYNTAVSGGTDYRQDVAGVPWTYRLFDSLGVVQAFYRYDFTSDAFIWSLDGTKNDFLMQDAAFYPGDDNLTDLGIGGRPWRRVYAGTYFAGGVDGKSGTFTTTDGKTITVAGGIVTNIA